MTNKKTLTEFSKTNLTKGELEELSKDELVNYIIANVEPGVKITFSGKSKARRIARKVQPRSSLTIDKLCVGNDEEQSKNLIIEGENLQAMVTLYRQRGLVDLILTDPPYNTGNDFRYNDKWEEDPNDPDLGDLVTEEDGARHTKWMKFMWPRLSLMKYMLKPSGVLAICIDHRELFRLGQMLDELFGEKNRLAIINWQKATALKNDNNHVSTSTEYILVYSRDEELATTTSLKRTESQNSRYSNPDNDPKDDWREGPLHARTWVFKDDYGIQSPFTGEISYPPGRSAWRHPKRNIKNWLEEWGSQYEEKKLNDNKTDALILKDGFSQETKNRAEKVLREGPWPFIWFGRKGDGIPRKKIYLSDVKAGKIPETFWAADNFNIEELAPDVLESTSWNYQESGRSSDGAAELTAIVGPVHKFETVKPLKLFSKVISIWCPPQGIVLDPFAGSGTTGHAVLALNHESGEDRRFIMIEQGRPEKGDAYAQTLTYDRMNRVIKGKWANSQGKPIPGGFRFTQLQQRVDAKALLSMEREEMTDTVIASHFDASSRGKGLITLPNSGYKYLVAKNVDNEGFYLVWEGASKTPVFDAKVYQSVVKEALKAGLKSRYHVYARFNLHQSEDVEFYQIPNQILIDFGLSITSDTYNNIEINTENGDEV